MTSHRVALLGECMLELQGEAFGAMRQHYGGDTFNTAVYLARCAPAGWTVSYASALGDDRLSDGLLARWAAQGLDLSLVQRLPGRMPGLYQIELDAQGERSFYFWREHSAARAYFEQPQTPLEAQAEQLTALYFSGISLAILPPEGRERVFVLARLLRKRGAHVVFDNNYRPRLWPQPAQARAAFERAFDLASLSLVTLDDHQALWALADAEAAQADAAARVPGELVLKRGAQPARIRLQPGDGWLDVPTEQVPRVVDTTAAGDSFAAGYLSRRLAGQSAEAAAAFGNRLAARVIQHAGAVIDRALMADLVQAGGDK